MWWTLGHLTESVIGVRRANYRLRIPANESVAQWLQSKHAQEITSKRLSMRWFDSILTRVLYAIFAHCVVNTGD